MEFRKLKKEDISQCVEIANLNFEREGYSYDMGSELTLALIEVQYNKPEFYVCEISGRIVGFGGLSNCGFDDSVYGICSCYIHPDFHRQGIGKRIVEIRLERIKELGGEIVFSTTQKEWHLTRFGFSVIKSPYKEWKLMQLNLNCSSVDETIKKMVQPPVITHGGKVIHGKKWMPAMYVAYYGIIESLAKQHGYALAVHGSITRDFDLFAIPFEPTVSTHEVLLAEIRKAVGIESSSDKIFDLVGHEAHGRTCYTIECGGGGYFDISFTPTLQQAMDKIKSDMQRAAEVDGLLKQVNNISYIHEPGTENILATIDRTYADTIDVKLPCGYRQKFWVDFTDQQAYEQILKMKKEGIESI